MYGTLNRSIKILLNVCSINHYFDSTVSRYNQQCLLSVTLLLLILQYFDLKICKNLRKFLIVITIDRNYLSCTKIDEKKTMESLVCVRVPLAFRLEFIKLI